MKEYIEKAMLYKEIAELEELARKRALDTPTNSPAYARYVAQLNERTKLKHKIYDFPSADVDKVSHGEWKIKMTGAFQDIRSYSCSNCGFRLPLNPTKIPLYCEDCGARMTEERVYGESET